MRAVCSSCTQTITLTFWVADAVLLSSAMAVYTSNVLAALRYLPLDQLKPGSKIPSSILSVSPFNNLGQVRLVEALQSVAASHMIIAVRLKVWTWVSYQTSGRAVYSCPSEYATDACTLRRSLSPASSHYKAPKAGQNDQRRPLSPSNPQRESSPPRRPRLSRSKERRSQRRDCTRRRTGEARSEMEFVQYWRPAGEPALFPLECPLFPSIGQRFTARLSHERRSDCSAASSPAHVAGLLSRSLRAPGHGRWRCRSSISHALR